MTTLAQRLQTQLRTSGLTQQAASVHAGVSAATISQMLNQGHIPRIEILFRLADFFRTPREQVLRIAARMPVGDDPQGEDDYLIEELIEEFRQVPDAWKEEAVRQIAMFRRLAEMPSVRFIGEEDGDDDQEPGA